MANHLFCCKIERDIQAIEFQGGGEITVIEKVYDKIENNANFRKFVKTSLVAPRNDEHVMEIIIACSKLAGMPLTKEEFLAYQRAGMEKITQQPGYLDAE